MDSALPVTASLRADFARDGVVHVPGCLDAADLARLTELFDRSLAQPSGAAANLARDDGTTFHQDLGNTRHWEAWAEALRASALPRLLAGLWGCDDVWFYYEQVFLKEGGATRRTPWHQDSSYLPVTGTQIANLWIPLDPVAADDALELIPGSHRGPQHAPSRFDPADETAPIDPADERPRLPAIEADRSRFTIRSWACQPGDVVVFDLGVLHGGAATRPGGRRRTVALRCFGPDARLAAQAGAPSRSSDRVPRFVRYHRELTPGQPLADQPAFPRLLGA